MKINQIVTEEYVQVEEGFWDDIKSAYKAGQKDYIARKAAELGITPQAAVQQAQSQPPGSTAPAARTQGGGKVPGQVSQTPGAIKKRATRAAGKPTTAAPAPTAAPAAKPATTAAPAAPAATPTTAAPAPTAKPRMSVRAATGPAPTTAAPAAPAAKPTTAAPAPTAAPAAKPATTAAPAAATYDAIQKSVAGLSKAEQRKLLGQLLKSSGTPVAAAR